MFQEVQRDEGSTLIHSEPCSTEIRPDSPKWRRDKSVLESSATGATLASCSRLTG